MLLLASMLLPLVLPLLLLAPMLLQLKVLFLSLVYTVSGVHAFALVHAVPSTFAVAGVSSVVGPTVTGIHATVLPYSPCCCLYPSCGRCFWCCWPYCYWRCLFFVPPCGKSFLVSGGRPFNFPMLEHVLLEGPENFSGMGECKRSSSRDQKSLPAFMGECKKDLLVAAWKHVPYWQRAFPSLVMEFSIGEES